MNPPRLILAGTALLSASTHVEGVEVSKKVRYVEKDHVAVEKAEELASVLEKKEPSSSLTRVSSSPNVHRKGSSTMNDLVSKGSGRLTKKRSGFGSHPDSGAALRKLPNDKSEEKTPLRPTYGHYAHTKSRLRGQHRQLEVAETACNGTQACNNSYPICARNGSCVGDYACESSPGLQAEDYACRATRAEGTCQDSPNMVVGSNSCFHEGTISRPGKTPTRVCASSAGACVGQQSCRSSGFSCSLSRDIHIGDGACNNFSSCFYSPSSTIHPFSCNSPSACSYSTNLTVEQYSCNEGDYACGYSSSAHIGQFACICDYCCQWLEPGCEIPDFECNSGPNDCSFNSTVMGCPAFV